MFPVNTILHIHGKVYSILEDRLSGIFAINTILHPTDFSRLSAHGLRVACALAREHGANLLLLHVRQPLLIAAGAILFAAPAPAESERQLRAGLERLPPPGPEIRVDCSVAEGNPVAEIIRSARACKCDLIVMGSHGLTGLETSVMGSVAREVVRRAPCPVLTVKAPPPESAPAAAPLREMAMV